MHEVPRLRTVRAGVHRERPADGSRDPGEELAAGVSLAPEVAGELRASGARPGPDQALAGLLDPAEAAGSEDDHSFDAAVAHEQVAPEPDPEDRVAGTESGEEVDKVLDVRRDVDAVGRTPGPPGGHAGHRDVAHQTTPHGSPASARLAAAVPISPAPSSTRTSSVRTTPHSVAPSSPTPGT